MTEPIQAPPVEGLDLDDTTGCSVGECCEVCGTGDDLAVGTMRTFGGIACLTICPDCAIRPLPGLPPLTALTRCGGHAEHLGIDLDVMAAVIDDEDGDQ